MAGRFFMLRQIADFAPGFFENTVVEDGCVQLSRTGGTYSASGSYTSVVFHSEAFFSLMPSWNASTPPGTSVEMQVRVSAQGRWSQWFGFGKWSPFIDRATPATAEDDIAKVEGEILSLADGCPAADRVQLRMMLYAETGEASPKLRLMAASTNAAQQVAAEPPVFDRELELPCYASLNRDPGIAGRMAGATTLAMLMNRWGRDLLPEEVARCAYDNGAGRYGNLAFLCATAGAWGFASHLEHASMLALRREVWQGRAVGARVQYRVPDIGQPEQVDDYTPQGPVLEGARFNSSGHLVAVRGFVLRDGAEHVVFNDPLAENDKEVRREVSLQQFARIYTGLALFLRHQPGSARTTARPARSLAQLSLQNGQLQLLQNGEELLPAKLADRSLSPSTVCYTVSDGIAYASAAQQKFYYPALGENEQLDFDEELSPGRKLTLYLIGPRGESWVGEKGYVSTSTAAEP